MEFHHILKAFRESSSLTQQEVVERLCKHFDFHSLSTISYHRWESGKVTPPVKKQAKILLVLGCIEELRNMCTASKRSLPFFETALTQRWDSRLFGFDCSYDGLNSINIEYKRINTIEDVPFKTIQLQYSIYGSKEQYIKSQMEQTLKDSEYNFMLIAQQQERLYGQLALHVMTSAKLTSYFKRMKYNTVNTPSSLDIEDDTRIVFLSSLHSTRKEVFLTLLKTVMDEIFKLKEIPAYMCLRLHDDITNTLVKSLFEPRLMTIGRKDIPRVQHINTHYGWLSYLIPTHLFLLSYGSVLDYYNEVVEKI